MSTDAGPLDAGSADAGSADAGPLDAGSLDAGPLDASTLADAGPLDAGPLDAGPLDTGSLDAGSLDAGSLDAGPLDAGPLDAGSLDAGSLDAGPLDAGPLDAGVLDAGLLDGVLDAGPDAGVLDAGSLDAGPLDAGPLDAGSLDAGSLDAGSLDAGSLDAGSLDAGSLDAGRLDAGGESACQALIGAFAQASSDGEPCGVVVGAPPLATCTSDCSGPSDSAVLEQMTTCLQQLGPCIPITESTWGTSLTACVDLAQSLSPSCESLLTLDGGSSTIDGGNTVDAGNIVDGGSDGGEMDAGAQDAGSCDWFTPCVPENPCDTGQWICPATGPSCQDMGVQLANGTACPAGVCYGGQCVGCGADCTPIWSCSQMTLSCEADGGVTCQPTGQSLPDLDDLLGYRHLPLRHVRGLSDGCGVRAGRSVPQGLREQLLTDDLQRHDAGRERRARLRQRRGVPRRQLRHGALPAHRRLRRDPADVHRCAAGQSGRAAAHRRDRPAASGCYDFRRGASRRHRHARDGHDRCQRRGLVRPAAEPPREPDARVQRHRTGQAQLAITIDAIAPPKGDIFGIVNDSFTGGTGAPAGPGTTLQSGNISALAVASDGTAYFTDSTNCLVRVLSVDGVVSDVVGTSGAFNCGFSGDNGPALQAKIASNPDFGPTGLALDEANQRLYVADTGNNRVRVVDLRSGIITTYAGGGSATAAPWGDGSAADEATLSWPEWIGFGPDGAFYIADVSHYLVRYVTPDGDIHTLNVPVVTSGQCESSPSLAIYAGIGGLAWDSRGNLYMSAEIRLGSGFPPAILRVDSAGNLTVVAGAGGSGTQNGVAAAQAGFGSSPLLALIRAITCSRSMRRGSCVESTAPRASSPRSLVGARDSSATSPARTPRSTNRRLSRSTRPAISTSRTWKIQRSASSGGQQYDATPDLVAGRDELSVADDLCGRGVAAVPGAGH